MLLFRWGALGAAGAPGAAGAFPATGGVAGNADPFLMCRSPLLVLIWICAAPDPIFPLTVLFSSPLIVSP